MQETHETQVRCLGQEDALEEVMALILSGESHGQRSPAGYSPWGRGHKIRHDLSTEYTHTYTTKVKSVYWRKSTDDVYKTQGLWCPTGVGGGCYSAAETPEAEALLQVQNYLKLCTQAPYQRFFKAIVIDECQLIWKKEHLWHHVGHATRADKRPGKMC